MDTSSQDPGRYVVPTQVHRTLSFAGGEINRSKSLRSPRFCASSPSWYLCDKRAASSKTLSIIDIVPGHRDEDHKHWHSVLSFCIRDFVLSESFKMTFNSTIAYQMEHPDDNQQRMIQIVTAVMIVIASISMVMRWVSRYMKQTPLGWEDHTMLAGWVFTTSSKYDRETQLRCYLGLFHYISGFPIQCY